MEATIVSASIAAAVSLAGAGVTLYSSRHQLATKLAELDLKREELSNLSHSKLAELDLKRVELENFSKQLIAEAEALRQNLMRDIVAKRTEAYAALWKVFITYERNWLLEKKPFDLPWAEAFVRELNATNAEHGVFYSEQVYVPFFEYRKRLLSINSRLQAGAAIDDKDIEQLVEVSSLGIEGRMQALAAAMKNDLGSYMRVAIQAP